MTTATIHNLDGFALSDNSLVHHATPNSIRCPAYLTYFGNSDVKNLVEPLELWDNSGQNRLCQIPLVTDKLDITSMMVWNRLIIINNAATSSIMAFNVDGRCISESTKDFTNLTDLSNYVDKENKVEMLVVCNDSLNEKSIVMFRLPDLKFVKQIIIPSDLLSSVGEEMLSGSTSSKMLELASCTNLKKNVFILAIRSYSRIIGLKFDNSTDNLQAVPCLETASLKDNFGVQEMVIFKHFLVLTVSNICQAKLLLYRYRIADNSIGFVCDQLLKHKDYCSLRFVCCKFVDEIVISVANLRDFTIERYSLFSRVKYSEDLFLAVRQCDVEKVKSIIDSGADFVDSCDDVQKQTALHLAVAIGYYEMVQLLIDNEASIDVCNIDGDTPLHLAVGVGNLEVTKLILDNSTSQRNLQNNKGETPIYLACHLGRLETLQLLLGAVNKLSDDINICNDDGNTPLMAACKSRNEDIVRELFADPKLRVDIQVKNKLDLTCFNYADFFIKQILLRKEITLESKRFKGVFQEETISYYWNTKISKTKIYHQLIVCRINKTCKCVDESLVYAGQLHHVNIVHLYHCMVTREPEIKIRLFPEFIADSKSLQSFVERKKRIPIKHVCRQILSALSYLKSKSAVHGRLEPKHILIVPSSSFVVKLKKVGCCNLFCKQTLTSLSRSKKYMAPEVLNGKQVTHKSDMYSFGIVLQTLMLNSSSNVVGESHEVTDDVTQENPDDRPDSDEILDREFFRRGVRRVEDTICTKSVDFHPYCVCVLYDVSDLSIDPGSRKLQTTVPKYLEETTNSSALQSPILLVSLKGRSNEIKVLSNELIHLGRIELSVECDIISMKTRRQLIMVVDALSGMVRLFSLLGDNLSGYNLRIMDRSNLQGLCLLPYFDMLSVCDAGAKKISFLSYSGEYQTSSNPILYSIDTFGFQECHLSPYCLTFFRLTSCNLLVIGCVEWTNQFEAMPAPLTVANVINPTSFQEISRTQPDLYKPCDIDCLYNSIFVLGDNDEGQFGFHFLKATTDRASTRLIRNRNIDSKPLDQRTVNRFCVMTLPFNNNNQQHDDAEESEQSKIVYCDYKNKKLHSFSVFS